MVTREPCPTCGQSEATPRRTVPSSAGYRCPDCKRFKIRDTTPEPCVVCNGWGMLAAGFATCHVCIGSGKRPSPWGWTASLGPENSSEVGTGAKDPTGGKSETRRMARAEALEVAVRAERERVLGEIENSLKWHRNDMAYGVITAAIRRIRAGEP